MNNKILLDLGKLLLPIPQILWRGMTKNNAAKMKKRIKFMTADDHRVRDFVVREIVKKGAPLSPDLIANSLDIPTEKTQRILANLEKRMIFLFRNDQEAVSWAYPVTSDTSPYQLISKNKESTYAACGIDAIAVPYVQGQLLNDYLKMALKTTCAHCGQAIELDIDSELNYQLSDTKANPLIFVPFVNIPKLEAPSIIDDF